MIDRYAVIGNPISHSKSPLIHREFARQTGQEMVYEAIEAPVDRFASVLAGFRAAGGKGANVTVPFKVEAFSLATSLTERARLAEAVNVLRFDGDVLHGDNVDGIGLVRDIQENLRFRLRDARVLLMGAGGAARGSVLPILAEGPRLLAIANRTPSKALALADRCSRQGRLSAGGYPDLGDQAFDLVINATSASLQGALPAVPATAFTGCALAYDLVYGKGLTPFLRFARASGAARLADGIGMLLEQAAESFQLWRGVRPETGKLIESFSVPLE
jgi:shikimate dehydrogenase